MKEGFKGQEIKLEAIAIKVAAIAEPLFKTIPILSFELRFKEDNCK